MKLSEAIRAGAALRPKRTGRMFGFTAAGGYGSCALGAAFECIMGQMHFDEHEIQNALRARFPVLSEHVDHPLGGNGWGIAGVIQDLNDCCDWSREAIAEWVEVIENKLETESRLSSGHQDTMTVQAAAPVSGETVNVG